MKIYLACPYTGMEEFAFEQVNRVAGALIANGEIVLSPISHCHPIAKQCQLNDNWETWKNFCLEFISWCDMVYVLCYPGWHKSKGVKQEIYYARKLGKPVRLYSSIQRVKGGVREKFKLDTKS